MSGDRGQFTPSTANGFTLVELLIAVTIIGVLLLVVAPAFNDMVQNNRMVSEVYELRATLSKARAEALTRRQWVTVCRSDDGENCAGTWNDGHIAFVDSDNDGAVDDPNEIFLANVQGAGTLDVTYGASNTGLNPDSRVRFNSRGYATDFDGTFTICDIRGADSARGLIVAGVGSIRAATADDPNSFADSVLDHEGDPLECD